MGIRSNLSWFTTRPFDNFGDSPHIQNQLLTNPKKSQNTIFQLRIRESGLEPARPRGRARPTTRSQENNRPTLREPRAALANSPFTAHRDLTSSHLGAKSK